MRQNPVDEPDKALALAFIFLVLGVALGALIPHLMGYCQ